MRQVINLKLKKRLNEVFIIPPNDLGEKRLTDFYKWLTSYLKTMPFIIVIPIATLIVFGIYFLFGFLVVRLTTLLQYGF